MKLTWVFLLNTGAKKEIYTHPAITCLLLFLEDFPPHKNIMFPITGFYKILKRCSNFCHTFWQLEGKK